MIFIYIFFGVVVAWIMFMIGALYERKEWNKLINDGIIRKPY